MNDIHGRVILAAELAPGARRTGDLWLAGFKKIGEHDKIQILELATPVPQPVPAYVTLTGDE